MKKFFKTDIIYRIICQMIRLFCSALVAGVITVMLSFFIDSVLLGIGLNVGSIFIPWAILTLVIFCTDLVFIRNKMFLNKGGENEKEKTYYAQ